MLEKIKKKNSLLARILSSTIESILKRNADKLDYNKETDIFEIQLGPDKKLCLKLDEKNKKIKVTFKKVFLNDDKFTREEKEIMTIALPESHCESITKILKALKQLFDPGKGSL